jgi:hypothetical protein
MRRIFVIVSAAVLLSACSTVPVSAPARIDPPPVALTSKCVNPDPLPKVVTAQDLATWTVAWIGTAGCERAKRAALVKAWPR